ncbi:transcriptional regulator, LuxR family [Beutenbergia cavernae DSM 12333]|uniref:Transcriptional regulator, LuxR family n=1 Tax=Beutenbergia cavernae (strain ATCC BAA-8 / DSM 12333 / CCUG 43141 / JCM 11478 / NBRC 16432 / NCIMB 13614 / HKI 0122) TaxID=471853 RepID=C5C1N9_BEUC1|nr:AAA family ATPase [Beutenbergia cavernae]ACQ79507.1 transcriptional regulator, LuxR family [Beutenbergia cavernae DSM 12333]
MPSWPFAAREQAQRALVGHIRSRAGSLLLSGAAGTGKTRLAREVSRSLEAAGWTVHWATAGATLRDQPLAALALLVPDFGSDPLASLRAAVAALDDLGDRSLLVVDDAHWLDDVSALVLRSAIERSGTAVLLVVRDEEHLSGDVAALAETDALTRVDVPPLRQEEVAEVLTVVLNGRVDPSTVRQMWELSAGNALFLRLLIDDAVETGGLLHQAGVWTSSVDGMQEGPALAAAVEDRIAATLDRHRADRDLAELLAFAEPVRLDVLEVLVPTSDLDGRRTEIERLEATGLVQMDAGTGPPVVRFAHPLFGEHLRARTGSLRARRLHSVIATALRRRGESDPVRLAGHLYAAGEKSEPGIFARAANAALRRLDLRLATKFAEVAFDAAPTPRTGFDLAFAASWSGEGRRADDLVPRLHELATTPAEHAAITQVAAANLAFMLKRPDEALHVLDRAAARGLGDPTADAEIRAMRCWLRSFEGDLRGARDDHRRVRDVDGLSSLGRAAALVGSIVICALQGEPLPSSLAASAPPTAVGSYGTAIERFVITEAILLHRRLSGDVRGVDELVADAASMDVRLSPFGALSRSLRGFAAHAAGAMDAAVPLLLDSLTIAEEAFTGGWEYITAITLTEARALLGDARGARESWADVERHRHPAVAMREPSGLLARTWLEVSEGRHSAARATASGAAELARDRGFGAVEVVALETMVRLGGTEVAGRLSDLAAIVCGPRAVAAAAAARAAADGDDVALRAAARLYERMGDLAVAADVEALAAVRSRATGHLGSAISSRGRALELAARCGGLDTPALRAARSGPALSVREGEVTALAARGLTNRQIAELLTLSVRTVEGHRYRAGLKLTADGRSDSQAGPR